MVEDIPRVLSRQVRASYSVVLGVVSISSALRLCNTVCCVVVQVLMPKSILHIFETNSCVILISKEIPSGLRAARFCRGGLDTSTG